MTKLKLGVAGTHSTGKTTLLREIKSRLAARKMMVESIEDLATCARSIGFPILQDHTFESTLWIMSRGISLELEAGLRADVILVDRPVMDALAYLFAALARRNHSLPQNKISYLLEVAKYHAQTYDIIFKTVLDPSFPLGEGRDSDLDFRASVASELDIVFDKISVSPRIVELGPEFIDSIEGCVVNMLEQQ